MVEVTKIGNKTLVMNGKILSLFRKGSLLRQMYYGGYEDFDNANGGVWKKYIHIPIKTVPLEEHHYRVVIDSTDVYVYNYDEALKAHASIADEFWNLVRSDGFDIRVFDELFKQLYFYIDTFDYTNKLLKMFVRLPAYTKELNIAFGNPLAGKSQFESGFDTFIVFSDFETKTLEGWTPTGGTWVVANYAKKHGNYGVDYQTKATVNRLERSLDFGRDIVVEWCGLNYEGEGGNSASMWMVDDADNGYVFNVDLGELAPYPNPITRLDAGTGTRLAYGGENVGYNNWGIIRNIILSDGTLVNKVWRNGTLLAEVTATDGKYSSFTMLRLHTARQSYFDYIKMFYARDQATFDTPRIEEF